MKTLQTTILSANRVFLSFFPASSLSSSGFDYRLPCVSLFSPSATEPKLVLSGSMRTHEYTTRGSAARSSIDSPFAEKPFRGIARLRERTTDVSSPLSLSYVDVLFNPRIVTWAVFLLHASSEKMELSTVGFIILIENYIFSFLLIFFFNIEYKFLYKL
jgi:hypothetical protein